ncbi:MAG TPA: hypothetical protein VKR58_05975 [Aquella sp.]|nr:hypothetical protein [Aquella sp.]
MEGEDWGRVLYLVANKCGIKWPEVLKLEQYMLIAYYEEAVYDEQLQIYNRASSL